MSFREDNLLLTPDDSVYTTSEVAVLMDMLEGGGPAIQIALRSANLEQSMLGNSATRISLRQQYRVQLAAECLLGGVGLSTRLARRLHVTTYGIAGYALLSSATLEDAIRFATFHAPLLNLKLSLSLEVNGSFATLRLADRYAMEDDMRLSYRVLETAKLAVLMRDVLGDDFRPLAAGCADADDAQLTELAELLGTRVERGGVDGWIRIDARLLRRALPQSHSDTHSACLRICGELIDGLSIHFDLVRHVKDILLKSIDSPPSLSDIADLMHLSRRTLRRRLEALETSYVGILEEVRKELAIRYLTTTQFTTEEIAERLGYSEAANFRHAFKRWTGASPRHFSASHQSTARGPERRGTARRNISALHSAAQALHSTVDYWN
jgi:AraC-like DNA-binding protein